jgi:hypothetical protein
MIETLSLLFGLGFSVLVYFRSIRPASQSPAQKSLYTIISTIGITGMVWLSGVLIADVLRKLNCIS